MGEEEPRTPRGSGAAARCACLHGKAHRDRQAPAGNPSQARREASACCECLYVSIGFVESRLVIRWAAGALTDPVGPFVKVVGSGCAHRGRVRIDAIVLILDAATPAVTHPRVDPAEDFRHLWRAFGRTPQRVVPHVHQPLERHIDVDGKVRVCARYSMPETGWKIRCETQ